MRRPCTWLAVAPAVLLLAPASAGADMRFAVDVTAAHEVEWLYADADAGLPCRAWSSGTGGYRVAVSARRPLVVALPAEPDLRTGRRIALRSVGRAVHLPAVASRTVVDWRDHRPSARCGEVIEHAAPAPGPARRDCAARRLALRPSLRLSPGGDRLTVVLHGTPAFPRCYPERHAAQRIRFPSFLPVAVTGADALLRLRRGATTTLRATHRLFVRADGGPLAFDATCPLTQPISGYGECDTTRVTLRVTRVR